MLETDAQPDRIFGGSKDFESGFPKHGRPHMAIENRLLPPVKAEKTATTLLVAIGSLRLHGLHQVERGFRR